MLKLGMEIVRLAGVAGSTASAKQTVQRAHSKKGGPLREIQGDESLPKARKDGLPGTIPRNSPKPSLVRKLARPQAADNVHTSQRGHALSHRAGAVACQRRNAGAKSSIPPSASVSEIKKVGTQVKAGRASHDDSMYNDESKLESALEYLKSAYRLAPKRPNPPLLVGSNGSRKAAGRPSICEAGYRGSRRGREAPP